MFFVGWLRVALSGFRPWGGCWSHFLGFYFFGRMRVALSGFGPWGGCLWLFLDFVLVVVSGSF